jgi:hypothetical protein
MCRVKAKKIEPGDINTERVAYIENSAGKEVEIILDSTQANHRSVVASEIGRQGDKVLIELPRETSSGDWRIWVNRSQLIK